MPMLDVSDVLLDPMFCAPLNITRRQQLIGDNGRVSITTSTLCPIGVVTMGTQQPLIMGPDASYAKNTITVHSTIQLFDPTTDTVNNYLPDIVNYNGNQYIVKKANDWSQYGNGFNMAEAELYTPITVANDE